MHKYYHKKPVNQAKVTENQINLLINLSLQGVSKKKIYAVEHFRCNATPKFACKECRHINRTIKAPSKPKEKFLASPYRYVSRMGAKKLKVLDSLIYFCKAFSIPHPSHEQIAAYAGCSVSYVTKSIDEFLELGLIGQRYFGVEGMANEYHLSVAFSWGWIKKQIASFFKNLTSFFIEQLMSVNKGEKKECIPYIYSNNSPCEIDSSYLDFFISHTVPNTGIGISNEQPGEKMTAKHSIPFYVDNIRSINLTVAGKVRLSGFPQEAIESIDRSIQNVTYTVTDPFAWFLGSGNRYCSQRGIEPDWGLVDELKRAHHISPTDPVLENTEINTVVFEPKRSPSKRSSAKQGNPERDRDAARYTSGSNAQADWWRETMALRNTDHSLYIERIKAYQQSLPRKKKDETTVTRTDLDIAWEHYCQSNHDVIALEETDPVNYAGYGYKMFLDSPWGSAYLAKASPTVRRLLSPLLSKVYPAQGTTTTDVQPTDPAPQPEATHLSEFRDISVWATHTVQTETLDVPYIDETSPWEEI